MSLPSHVMMTFGTLAAGLALAAAPVAAAPRLTGEQELAKMLEGRQPGAPTDCISLSSSHDSTIIEKTAIVYRDGATLWVNRPNNADSLHADDILVLKTSLSQLCRLDTLQLHDRSTHTWRGFVGLQQFVPWRKVAAQ